MASLIHQPCEKCGSSDAKAYYDDGGTKCFSCGEATFPKNKSNTRPLVNPNAIIPIWPAEHLSSLSNKALTWLSLRGITQAVATLYSLHCIYDENTLFVPQWDTNHNFIRYQTREIDTKKIRTYGKPYDPAFYSHRKGTKQLVIVEDAVSCMRVGEFMDCVALTGTALLSKTLENITKLGYTHYITWLDTDEAGFSGTKKLYNQLNKFGDVICILNTPEPKWMIDDEILRTLGRYDNWES